MRYFIRAVKYFLYFTVIFVAIISVLVLTGAAEGNISTMFIGGYSALWKIAIFFAVIAAIYPSVGFMTRTAATAGSWEENKDRVMTFMTNREYVLEASGVGTMTFRKTGVSRFTRMYEDRITLTAKIGGIEVEGLRKDVMRIVTGLESRLGNISTEE